MREASTSTVADQLTRMSMRRFIWAGLLAIAWIALVIVDMAYGIAKHEWMHTPSVHIRTGCLAGSLDSFHVTNIA